MPSTTTSSWLDVSYGIPQGSVIGPTLSLIFIIDIQDNIKSPLRLVANDCVIYREIVTDNDYHILQQDLMQLSSWSATSQMKFNVKNCAVLSITRKRSCIFEYQFDNDAIPRTNDYKYLGLAVTNDLRWNLHCQNLRHYKASRTLGLIRKTCHHAQKRLKPGPTLPFFTCPASRAMFAFPPNTLSTECLSHRSSQQQPTFWKARSHLDKYAIFKATIEIYTCTYKFAMFPIQGQFEFGMHT